MKSSFSLEEQAVIRLLKGLKSVKADYPPKMLAKRRAAFIRQVAQWEKAEVEQVSSLQDRNVIKLLKGLKSNEFTYPTKMLAKRRTAFIKQIAKWEKVEVGEEQPLQSQDLISLLESLKPIKSEYPRELLAKRRSAFIDQVLQHNKSNWWETLRANIHDKLINLTKPQGFRLTASMLVTLVVVSFIVVTSLGSLIFANRDQLAVSYNNLSSTGGISKPHLATPTSALELVAAICKPGRVPPLCPAKTFNRSRDLTFQGNGFARAAVAKDTLPEYQGIIYKASNVNDGFYGSGASWVSYSANSWIKIDLGQTTTISMVTFGKDRLRSFIGHDPGQFSIAVALTDNVYANGDSTNDNNEYQQIFDSRTVGFTGMVSGSETVQVSFKPVLARYIKITVTNPEKAIDEVEVFYNPVDQSSASAEIGKANESVNSQLPSHNYTPTNVPSLTKTPNDTPTLVPTSTPTPKPTNTPTRTPTDTPLPIPTDTLTAVPTDTPIPTDTLTPVPTDTAAPTDTPIPTDTQVSLPYP